MAERTAERTAEQLLRGVEASLASEYSESRETEGEEDGEEEEDEDEEEDELRRAARAGILLLEKNHELQNENAALRLHLKALESERPGLEEELQRRESELELLREERRQSLMEATRLQGELRSKSLVVTSSLDREQRLKEQKEAAETALALAETKFRRLEQEAEERTAALEPPAAVRKEEVVVANPAATYDSNQCSTFSLAEYEELSAKWLRAAEENESLHVELRSLRKDLDALKRKAGKLSELPARLERLDKKALKLQHANDALAEELAEERALNESQRTMIAVYKKIADARPFSTECTCALHPEGDERDGLGESIQDQLLETNMRLERELRELRARLAGEDEDARTVDESTDNNSSQTNNTEDDESSVVALLAAAGDGESVAVSTDGGGGGGGSGSGSGVDFLIKKNQDLEEKHAALRDSLRHAKMQWQAAIASQKALEECNRAAQAEITRLTQQVEHKVVALVANQGTRGGGGDDSGDHAGSLSDGGTPVARRVKAPDGIFDENDEDEKWMEEMAPYPAPPGDLNSPLIKCLLDHWTTDKSKIMHLTDWLHHAIRGTGKPRPLRLEHLTSEVAAGFTQLLVPILRERHGVSVTIYRRESIQILTDMVFQAQQPAQTQPQESPGIFSTLAAALAGVISPTPTPPASSDSSRPLVDRSNSGSSAASSESGSTSGRARRRRPENSLLIGEAHFLYG